MLSALQVFEVMSICICLPFKTDIQIGIVPISVLYQSENPFKQIENVKRNEKQFLLLFSMNTLVVDDILVNP